MSVPQVGQGGVAIVPTFKGFRSAVNKETDTAAKSSARGFRAAWSKEGATTGKTTGAGFRKAFEGEAKGFADKSTEELARAVTKASRTLSQARLKQLDQAGKVRVAEAQLAEAQSKHAAGSSQVVRAMERLQSETRKLEDANESTARSTKDLRDAQSNLAAAADRAGGQLAAAGRTGGRKFISGFREVFAGSFLGTTLANFASNIATRLASELAQGIRRGLDFALGTVDIASDLNESVNAVTVSYGKAAEAVLALGDTSAKTFGLSRRNLNAYAVQFSAFVSTIAGSKGDITATFSTLLGRATDFASVMNLEVADALELFQSGLAGETEPLRKYGIDLSAATVEQYAWAKGLAASGEELTEQQKVQARYGALLAQTAKVQGDFLNTSDQLANQNRINAATWDDLQAQIGTAFLPVATELARIISTDVLPAISGLIEGPGSVKGLKGAFGEATPAIELFGREVLPLLPDLFKSIAETLPSLIQLTTELAPVVLELAKGTNSWFVGFKALIDLLTGNITLEEYGAKLQSLSGSLGEVTRGVQFFGAVTRLAFTQVQTTVGNTVSVIQARIDQAVGFIGSLPKRAADAVAGIGNLLYNSGRSLIQGFINGVRSMLRPVGDAVSGVLEWAKGFFPNSPAKRGPFSGTGWTNLPKSGSAVMEQWQSGFARPDLNGALSPVYAATTSMAGSASAQGLSLDGAHITGTLEIGGDGLARIVDGRISINEQSRLVTATSGRRRA